MRYDDLLNIEYPFKLPRARMPRADRAAQFAPFAALTGYEEALSETARRTHAKPEIDEYEAQRIDRVIQESLSEKKKIKVLYFVPDPRKEGGSILEIQGVILRVDQGKNELVFENKERILLENIYCAEHVNP